MASSAHEQQPISLDGEVCGHAARDFCVARLTQSRSLPFRRSGVALSNAGPQSSAIDGRPLRARKSVSLRGRLWTLTYVHGTVFARLGGGPALAGRCGGGVGRVGRASTMHVHDPWAVAVYFKCAVCVSVFMYLVALWCLFCVYEPFWCDYVFI